MKHFKDGNDVKQYAQPSTYAKGATVQAVQVNEEFMLDSLEYQNQVFPAGSYVCIGIDNEIWRVDQSIFERTYSKVAVGKTRKQAWFDQNYKVIEYGTCTDIVEIESGEIVHSTVLYNNFAEDLVKFMNELWEKHGNEVIKESK